MNDHRAEALQRLNEHIKDRTALEAAFAVIARMLAHYEGLDVDQACDAAGDLIRAEARSLGQGCTPAD